MKIYRIALLLIAFIWDVKYRDESRAIKKRERTYINFAFLYFILGKEIKNLLIYINTGDTLGVILFAEGVLAFGLLSIFEFINFFRYEKWEIRYIYYIVVGFEIVKLFWLLP